MDNGTKRLVTSLPDERELQVEKSRDSTPALAIPCMSPSIHYRIMSGQACSTRTSEDLDDPDCDAQGYSDFQVDFPSVLERFSDIMQQVKGKQLAVFLDYDGTLTPIVRDPDAAVMSEAMRGALREVASMLPTAIISGRCVEKVVGFVKLRELFYAGSHGLDIQGPEEGLCKLQDPSMCSYQPAAAFYTTMNLVYDALVEAVKHIPGSNVEHNKYCVSTHFRNCAPEDWEAVEALVQDVVARFEGLCITMGKKVFEVRPNVPWNKGKALLFLLEKLGVKSSDEAITLYIGDDITDEDAFKVLRESGHGYGILVAKKPRSTAAAYTLRDPDEVLQFLKMLGQWAGTERTKGQLRIPRNLSHDCNLGDRFNRILSQGNGESRDVGTVQDCIMDNGNSVAC